MIHEIWAFLLTSTGYLYLDKFSYFLMFVLRSVFRLSVRFLLFIFSNGTNLTPILSILSKVQGQFMFQCIFFVWALCFFLILMYFVVDDALHWVDIWHQNQIKNLLKWMFYNKDRRSPKFAWSLPPNSSESFFLPNPPSFKNIKKIFSKKY